MKRGEVIEPGWRNLNLALNDYTLSPCPKNKRHVNARDLPGRRFRVSPLENDKMASCANPRAVTLPKKRGFAVHKTLSMVQNFLALNGLA
jgi:hypothetical protein